MIASGFSRSDKFAALIMAQRAAAIWLPGAEVTGVGVKWNYLLSAVLLR
jgi:hypothetical protein